MPAAGARLHAERLIAWAEAAAVAAAAADRRSSRWRSRFVGALVCVPERRPGSCRGRLAVVNVLALAWLAKRANAIVESLSSATESAALDLLSNVICGDRARAVRRSGACGARRAR